MNRENAARQDQQRREGEGEGYTSGGEYDGALKGEMRVGKEEVMGGHTI